MLCCCGATCSAHVECACCCGRTTHFLQLTCSTEEVCKLRAKSTLLVRLACSSCALPQHFLIRGCRDNCFARGASGACQPSSPNLPSCAESVRPTRPNRGGLRQGTYSSRDAMRLVGRSWQWVRGLKLYQPGGQFLLLRPVSVLVGREARQVVQPYGADN